MTNHAASVPTHGRPDGVAIAPALIEALRHYGRPLPGPEQGEEFGAAFDRFGHARVVLLGESTHGTAEFYRARAAITRRLIERHGFTIVAVEADWPDGARIDDYVRHHAPRPWRGPAFARFPRWMWRNTDIASFVHWLHQHNAEQPDDRRVSFHGLDIYSLGESIHAVLTYLDRMDPEAAKAARARYARLTPWQDDPARYGNAVMRHGHDSSEDAVVAQLRELLARRLHDVRLDGAAWFDAVQNARIVRAAEQYYRIMYRAGAESWNLRDRHMFGTIQALLAHRGEEAKAVIWAHNSHVGHAAATAMGWEGQFNIGELCRMAHGDEAALIGFSTDRGTVAAAHHWDAEMEVMTVRPARADSYEHAFLHAGLPRALFDWRDDRHLRDLLRGPLRERAIGVIYRPDSELHSHYFEAMLADQFDAWVWIEKTKAVTPLDHALPVAGQNGAPHPSHPSGLDETWPFGL
ncbi:erythromycin esterase family protein [Nguyenibacter vanlangensis]|uniref:Erythromycin esterase family protein n=1 Tax=Nguyenibacter vanlangensis TaxID=1216886 RepID=A0A7Y7IYB0_9PROT|nr:erythromycin esterase family protein [Nguyenibacter vanlangensis]NVN12574.1 erythromycin esterase family protein [Nguyenibacter vanlangensis]